MRDDLEWWVASRVFDRLFQQALDSGRLPPELAYWRDVVSANGGISLYGAQCSSAEIAEARRLVKGLREEALSQMQRLGSQQSSSEWEGEQASLLTWPSISQHDDGIQNQARLGMRHP